MSTVSRSSKRRLLPRVGAALAAAFAMILVVAVQPVAAGDDSPELDQPRSGSARPLDISVVSPLLVPPNITGSRSADSVSVDVDSFNAVAISVRETGSIRLRAGADRVSASSTGDTGYGLNVEGALRLGSGRDELIGQGSFTGFQVVGVVDGGSGRDSLTGRGDSSAFTHNANGIEVAGGRAMGGRGNDRITGEAKTVTPGNVATGIAIYPVGPPDAKAVLDGGPGNDTITAVGVSPDGPGYGFRLAPGAGVRASGGSGSDVFEGYGTTAGFMGGTVDGGRGHDRFRARIIDASPDRAEIGVAGAVTDVTLSGGAGCDVFDVGYGQATIDGGPGRDAILLPGAAKDYVITGDSAERDISRDGYVLRVRSVERLLFGTSLPPGPGCGSVPDTATIGGTVVRTDGSPVEGIVVDYFTANSDGSRARFIGAERTSKDGTFQRTVEPRCYVLVFIAPDDASFVNGGRYLEKYLCVKAADAASVAVVLAVDIGNCTIQGQVVTTALTQPECDALVALFTASDGPNWTDKSGWNTPTDPCTWVGVGCSDERLRVLSLPNNLLTGSLPTEIGQMTNLQILELTDNRLRGAIPPEIGRLAQLRQLQLGSTGPSNNNFDTIPPELGQLTNLEVLDLQFTFLTGPIPPELGKLRRLRSFDASGGSLFRSPGLSGAIPPELGQLTSLENLDLGLNQLSGPIPPEMGQLTSLRTLDLSRNAVTAIPPELGQLANLHALDISNSRLTGPIPPELGQLTRLERLDLGNSEPGGNQLSGPIPAELGQLAKLRNLDLTINQLSGPIPPELGQLANIVTLNVASNQLSGQIPRELAQLGTVTTLNLASNQLTEVPPELGQLPVVLELELSNNLLTTVPPELGQLPEVAELGLALNRLTTVPEELGQLTTLTRLLLFDNQLTAVPAGLGQLTALERLDLRNNQLTSVPGELGRLGALVTLQLSGNQLTSIPGELGQMASLETLRLGDNQLASLPPEIGQLSNLDELSFFRNQLASLPAEIGQLQSLSFINGFSNQLTTLPAELSQLQNLRSARMTNNLLTGDITAALTGLQLFNIELGDGPGGNNCLTVADPALADALTALDADWDECDP